MLIVTKLGKCVLKPRVYGHWIHNKLKKK